MVSSLTAKSLSKQARCLLWAHHKLGWNQGGAKTLVSHCFWTLDQKRATCNACKVIEERKGAYGEVPPLPNIQGLQVREGMNATLTGGKTTVFRSKASWPQATHLKHVTGKLRKGNTRRYDYEASSSKRLIAIVFVDNCCSVSHVFVSWPMSKQWLKYFDKDSALGGLRGAIKKFSDKHSFRKCTLFTQVGVPFPSK